MHSALQKTRPLHKTNISVFTFISTMEQAKVHLSSTIITKFNLFGYVIYSIADAVPDGCVDWTLSNIAKWANSSNNGAGDYSGEMVFGLFTGRYRLVNTVVLVLWRYLKCLPYRMQSSWKDMIRQSISQSGVIVVCNLTNKGLWYFLTF